MSDKDAALKAIFNKPRPITVRDYVEGQTANFDVFLQTFYGLEKVTGYRFVPDLEIICGEANAGFGMAYKVSYETKLTRRAT